MAFDGIVIANLVKAVSYTHLENLQGEMKFIVEMKAVNHRYFDVNIKMPKKLAFFESAIRSTLKNYMHRGKIDVFITYEDPVSYTHLLAVLE